MAKAAKRLFSQEYLDFLKRFFSIVLTIVLLMTFWRLREIVLMVFLSIIIALTLSMPVVRLQALGLRRSYAIAGSIMGVLAFIIIFFFLMLPPIAVQTGSLIREMPAAIDAAEKSYNDFRDQNPQLKDLLPATTDATAGSSMSGWLGLGEPEIADPEQTLTETVGSSLPILTNAGNIVIALVVNILLIVIVAIYILIDPRDYAQGVIVLVPPGYQQRFVQVLTELRRTLTAWLTSLSFSITITFIMVYIAMRLWDIPNAMGLAAIAALSTIIPNLGALIPIIPIAIFTLADHPSRLLFVIGTYILIQQLEGAVLSPMVVKRQMNIPVGVVLVFQLIAANLFGFLGVLLAVPLLGVLITLVREIYVFDVLGVHDVELTLEEGSDGDLVITAEPIPQETAQVT